MPALVPLFAAFLTLTAQAPAPAECAGVDACRAATEAAIAADDFEHAHDLAWRTFQAAGPKNPSVMFLLARAQALSGRAEDALIMLRRIAELGAPVDASGDEFRRTRARPGWPDVEALMATVAARAADRAAPEPAPDAPTPPLATPASGAGTARVPAPAPEPAAAPPAAPPVAPGPGEAEPAAAPPAGPVEPEVPAEPETLTVSAEDAGRFTSRTFAPAGLVYDAVSRRFVFGDLPGRKLRIVIDGGTHSVDLAREAAGFGELGALDIDTRRGDLWVTSADPEKGTATLHKLQLISGRVLTSFEMPAALGQVRLVDLTVTTAGDVLLLDDQGRRLLRLAPKAAAPTVVVTFDEGRPTSVALGPDDRYAYVAGPEGLRRVDLRTRRVVRVETGRFDLAGLEQVRPHGRDLIAVQAGVHTRRLVRLSLDAAGAAVTGVAAASGVLPPGMGPAFAAVSGDTVSFLIGRDAGTAGDPYTEWIIRRVRLP
ncbi:MAG: hypothetical protein AB7O67_21425 [Vicinamibacterales bacterium]